VSSNPLTLREETFRVLFVGNPLPMWLWDLETLAFLEVNDAAIAAYGYSRDEFLHMRIVDIRPMEERQRLLAEIRRNRPELQNRGEWRHILRDGRLIDVEITSQVMNVQGRRVELAVVHDITARKEAELALRRTEEELRRLNAELELRVRQRTTELQAAVDELEAFSYSVSHDLRAPLRSIDGFSQAIVEDFGRSLDPEARRHLERIVAATQRMGQLIDDLLKLSRVTRWDMKRESVDLTDIAGKVAAELGRQMPDRQVSITVAPGMTAEGDPRLVRIAFENLLNNAWKFTGQRADASIEVGKTSQDGLGTVFYVRDNGAGFDPTYADKLFGAFQRLHAASEFPGTGIGLATVRRIVNRHGGRVWAEAKPGEGACFYFTLG
jgi:hypothetical protein